MLANQRAYLLATLAVLLSTLCCSRESAGAEHPCAAIPDDAARLACYDSAFGRPAGAPAAATTPAFAATGARAAETATTASTAAVSATTARTAEQQFGLHQPAVHVTATKPAAGEGPQKIESIATEIKRKPLGELVISLENGQVWEQVEVDSKVHIKPGDAVTVRNAAFGSYMMTSGYATLRVRRIR